MPGDGIDRDLLWLILQAPKRVSAGISSGPPVSRSVSASWKSVGRRRAPGQKHVDPDDLVNRTDLCSSCGTTCDGICG